MNEAFAIAIGYLLGSIPSAYVIARLKTGKDIRRLGGGNVGGLNVFREVGLWPGIAVVIVDFGKGAGAVATAYWLLAVPQPYVLLAALAAVIGHNWMVWLKFSGGKGMGTTIGTLLVLFPIYGYPLQLGIFAAAIIVPLVITRNVALSLGIGLLALPFIVWQATDSGFATILAIALGLLIVIRFLPTALAAISKSGGVKGFIFDHWQRGDSQKED